MTDTTQTFHGLRAHRTKPMTDRQQKRVDDLIGRFHAKVYFIGQLLGPDYEQYEDGSDTDIGIIVTDEDVAAAVSEFRC